MPLPLKTHYEAIDPKRDCRLGWRHYSPAWPAGKQHVLSRRASEEILGVGTFWARVTVVLRVNNFSTVIRERAMTTSDWRGRISGLGPKRTMTGAKPASSVAGDGTLHDDRDNPCQGTVDPASQRPPQNSRVFWAGAAAGMAVVAVFVTASAIVFWLADDSGEATTPNPAGVH